MEKEFFSWKFLNTYVGSVTCTSVIVELTKGCVDLLPFHVSTQLLVYVVALTVLLLSKGFTEGLNWQNASLCLLNAALIATTAIGGYEILQGINA